MRRALLMALRRCLTVVAVCAAVALALNEDQVDHDADPYIIGFVEDDSIGPDGPWWYISQAIDFPDQNVSMVPSVSGLSLAINASACSSQEASCPLPLPTMWTVSGAYQVTDGENTQSNPFDGSSWNADYAALLRLEGEGGLFKNRITLHTNGTNQGSAFLDGHGMGVSQNYTVTFPGGQEYTKDTGYLSLFGGNLTVDYPMNNGSSTSANRTLPAAYIKGDIPSISYGLHLGSVNPAVPASLTLGGYDSSRCLTDPIVSDETYVQLIGIALNVSSGGSAYANAPSTPITGLLQEDGVQETSLNVYPRPGVPYMYLPKDTCDAIAAHLPVTYNEDFNLYFWNTDDKAYGQITSSPHYLAFTFDTGNGENSTINVPFAVLNLTLESPLMSSPTKYFPCSPWNLEGTGYTLGSAFLQAAFLAQNWQTEKLFLAQAPGPDFLPPAVKKIGYTDPDLTPATNPPDWESSWSGKLKPLTGGNNNGNGNGNGNGSGNGNNGGGNSSASNGGKSDSSGISGGAIAGIVVGALAGFALVLGLILFLIRRRKKRSAYQPAQQQVDSPGPVPPNYGSPVVVEHQPVYETEAKSPTAELSGAGEVQELPGSEPGAKKTR